MTESSEMPGRTLRDELVDEMRTYESRTESILTVYFNDQTDNEWADVSVSTLDEYSHIGGDIDAVAYSAEYVYVLVRSELTSQWVPRWTFRGVPRANRLFGLQQVGTEHVQTQLTDLEKPNE